MRFNDYRELSQTDQQLLQQAKAALNQCIADAQRIRGDASGWLARAKSTVTGVDTATVAAACETTIKAATSMIATADRLLGDPNTDHDKVISFVGAAKEVADVSILRETEGYNSLMKMAHDVGAATLKDIKFFGLPIAMLVGAGLGLVILKKLMKRR